MTGNVKKALLFVALTFFFSWLLAGLFFYVLGGGSNRLAALAVLIVYMFIPMTMAIIVQKVIYKEPIREPLGISFRPNRWFLVAWILPPIIAFATIGVSLLFPGVKYSPEMAGFYEVFESVLTPEQLELMKSQAATLPIHPFWLSLVQGLIGGATINALAGLGEELGWRGLLQRRFGYLGFWKSSALRPHLGCMARADHSPGTQLPSAPPSGRIDDDCLDFAALTDLQLRETQREIRPRGCSHPWFAEWHRRTGCYDRRGGAMI